MRDWLKCRTLQAKRLREFFESEVALSLNQSTPLVPHQQTVKMRCRAFTAMQQSFHSLTTDDAVVTDFLNKRKAKCDQLRTLLIENGFKKAAENGFKKAAENGFKKVAENGFKKAAENGFKKVAENGFKKVAENGFKKAAENGFKKAAENGFKKAAENGFKKAAENGFKKAAEDVKPAMLSCSEMRVLKSQLTKLHGDRLYRILQPVLPALQQNAKQPVVLKLSALPATTLRSFQFEIQRLMEEDYLQSTTCLLW